MTSQFITAKELSGLVEMNERHIRRPQIQRRLGISTCRDTTCHKPIRWHRAEVRQRLSHRGYNTSAI